MGCAVPKGALAKARHPWAAWRDPVGVRECEGDDGARWVFGWFNSKPVHEVSSPKGGVIHLCAVLGLARLPLL